MGVDRERMSKRLVSDELCEVVGPLLPEEPLKTKGGRPRVDDRAALNGIIFELKSSIPQMGGPYRCLGVSSR
jgi:transposase